MLTLRKAMAAVATVIGFAAAAPASAVVLGGIDFSSVLDGNHFESATLAQTFVNGNGENAQAYGYITQVNGASQYCASAPCGLFYVANFTNSQNFSSSYVEFTSATVSVYYTNGTTNLFTQNSPTNVAAIQAMTPWLTLTGHNNLGGIASPGAVLQGTGTLTGQSLSGAGFGLFDVNTAGPGMADVEAALNTNTIQDAIGGGTDLALTSSFNNIVLNSFDISSGLADSCKAGTAAAGAWCYQGTSNFRGILQVPEPGMLGVLGLSMLGFVGFVRRRKS